MHIFKLILFFGYISIFIGCNSNSEMDTIIQKLQIPNSIDSLFVIHETFCTTCIYSTEDFFLKKYKFKPNILGIYLVETKNQYLAPSILENFRVVENTLFKPLHLDNSKLNIIAISKNKKPKLHPIEVAHYYSILKKLSQ